MLLGENTIRRLVDLELDIVAVSLAGTTAGTHDRFRKGTDFSKLISSLERLCKIKAEKKTQLPAVHLAYLMLRSNFRELKEILPLARKVGAKQVVASNLTLIMDSKLFPEAIFNDAGRMDHDRVALEEINDRAARENIGFDYHGPGLDDASMHCRENVQKADDASMHCRENVQKACVVNVEGEVVPCVLTNPVLSSHYIFKGQSLPLRAMPFGNIQNESLTRIWNKEEYARFRDLFDPAIPRKPEQIWSEMPGSCVQCYKRLGA
jgi:MoaA/NifB/PqqE/SkfB family radical SAM enzyme